MVSKSSLYDGRRTGRSGSQSPTEAAPVASRVSGALALLAGASLAQYGTRYRTIRTAALAVLGSSIVLRKVKTGKAFTNDQTVVHRVVTINKPPDQVKEEWRRLDSLPPGMEYLKSLSATGDSASPGAANGRFSLTPRPAQGSVSFNEPPSGRGTRLDLTISWRQPFGPLGSAVTRLTGRSPQARMEGDLRRVKALIEGGEMPMTSGQPAGERGPIGRLANAWARSH
ncbi:MAG TPA: hypothetical protein VIJ28_01525 [Chloroflexota bacterium]|jgi:uncharacterized membrane protein